MGFVMQKDTQDNVNWISDLVVKALCGACTILLAVAVTSLQSMNLEIKELNKSISDVSSQSRVILNTIEMMQKRIEKLEGQEERRR